MEDTSFDEKLSELVRRFPCFYDKTKKDYKDKNVVANAWKTVANELEIENGEFRIDVFALNFSCCCNI